MSKIEVNTIDTQCGSALQIGCTNTATIGLGKSGDTITIPSGATIVNSGTQTGFGRTGTVDWVTTVKVTGDSPITGVNGEGYFLNTTAGTITVDLPAGAAGSILAFKDYAGTWDSNAVTVTPNGSEKIAGAAGSATLSTERQSVTLIYIDSTQGWLDIHDSASNIEGAKYITATGGTPCAGATCGDYKTHTFTGPGTLCVSAAGNSAGSNILDYLLVAGGGGARTNGGGGGAGGFRVSNALGLPAPLTSPLANPTGITAAVQGYPIGVGGGGTAGTPPTHATNGVASTFSCLSSAGGGMSGGTPGDSVGGPGGSGGGGDYNTGGRFGGTGNTPVVSPPQGQNGGVGAYPYTPSYGGGGGGGAGAVGFNGCSPLPTPGQGGVGSYISPVFGTTYGTCGPVPGTKYFSGGGGADGNPANPGTTAGGSGGGGGGVPGATGTSGTVNTGGGGGGGGSTGGGGGSGIVIIRYKFQ